MGLFQELKRRNVIRVGIAYAVISWLILQVVDVVAPILELPGWVPKLVLLILLAGLLPVIIFSWVFELTPEGLKREEQVDRSQSIARRTAKKLDLLTIVLLLVVIALVVADRYLPAGSEQGGATVPVQTADEPGQTDSGLSIAVLPFVNMSSDPEQEYFSDGISEELLNVLAQIPGLRVAARTSAFQFKGQNRDIAEIAGQLRVNHVLEGSVRKSGSQLRITAQLIRADSGYHLWSNTWDRQLDDIFAIQDEISAAIASALKIELSLSPGDAEHTPASLRQLPSVPVAASAQAYEYYLKGRQLINSRSRAGIEQAMVVLGRALEHDPDYAPAHAQMAIAIALLQAGAGSYGAFSLDEVRTMATPHVDRAFALQPDLAEAYGARALLSQINYDFPAAITNARMALARNPSYVDAINWLYLSLINSGNWPEAQKTMEHMMDVDPLSIVGRINYAYMLGRYGRIDEAREVAEELARQSSGSSYWAHGLISGDYTGDIADASAWYLRALALDPGNQFGRTRLGISFATVGLYEEARRSWPEIEWLIDVLQQDWEGAIENARQLQRNNPDDNLIKLRLADVLHLSGALEEANMIYQQLWITAGEGALIDSSNTSAMPAARMAYGLLHNGDSKGAEKLLDLLRMEIRSREQAGIRDSYKLRAEAMLRAMEGDHNEAIEVLNKAIDAGLRARYILREPALSELQSDPRFQEIVNRLDRILGEERTRTLELICSDNPVPEAWQPLPETCLDESRSG